MSANVVVVTGSDTEVGKTVVTAALAAAASRSGKRVAVVKPAQTGVGPDEPGDVDEVRRLAGVDDVHELARFPDPLAPEAAARRIGADGIAPADVASYVRGLADRDLVLVEGAGGLLVRFDGAGGTLADVAALLAAPVVVVVRAGLGTLNHAALTTEALRARGIHCAGVVIGAWPAEPDLAARENLADLPVACQVPLLGRIPERAGMLSPQAFAAEADRWFETGGIL